MQFVFALPLHEEAARASALLLRQREAPMAPQHKHEQQQPEQLCNAPPDLRLQGLQHRATTAHLSSNGIGSACACSRVSDVINMAATLYLKASLCP